MRKITASLLVALMLAASTVSAAPTGSGRGGFMGFIAGCCFGLRAGAAYNDGKEIHWREWCMLIPYVNIVFAVWSGIDGANGMTSGDLAAKYGATYY